MTNFQRLFFWKKRNKPLTEADNNRVILLQWIIITKRCSLCFINRVSVLDENAQVFCAHTSKFREGQQPSLGGLIALPERYPRCARALQDGETRCRVEPSSIAMWGESVHSRNTNLFYTSHHDHHRNHRKCLESHDRMVHVRTKIVVEVQNNHHIILVWWRKKKKNKEFRWIQESFPELLADKYLPVYQLGTAVDQSLSISFFFVIFLFSW